MLWRTALALVLGGILPAAAEAGVKKIEVVNQTGRSIRVTVTADQVRLVESKDGVKADREYEAHLKVVNETATEAGKVKGSQKNEVDAGARVKTSDERTEERSYEWSPFIAAGEEVVANENTGVFAVEDAKGIFYVTVRFDDGGYVCVNAQKAIESQAKLIVDPKGFVIPPQGLPLTHGADALLSIGGKSLQDPVTSKGWPAGNLGSAPGVHVIEKTTVGDGLVRSGDIVKFRCARTPSGSDGYNKMYSSDKGWIYYDQDSGNEKQQWVLLKVRGSADDSVIRDGDVVRVRNRFFDRGYLHDYDGTWASCENDRTDEWKISFSR